VIKINRGTDFSIIDCGVIKNSRSVHHSECLRRLSGGISELISKYNPDSASIEEAFLGRNVKTAIILSMARGCVITALAQNNIPVYPYSPRKAKKAAVGTGSASKQQIALIMSRLFGINTESVPEDATDALALAVCHAQLYSKPDLKIFLPEPV
jgi:crossover junction endodeoxyribonuclease RuvC